ncbi:hypothetical protein K461DRAFT_297935 [Myriangium duriaei CBS 260.36]|uniref:Uncharacterized protein n=1 Tax=Myriangium duriaei CBS 260.36 TaxID=1168546 RepID=A0A9P4ITP7_9PEZI|nr:hypothetical protein K461DRAFT_297935 [Myriangium duriaei CBS 260.36]
MFSPNFKSPSIPPFSPHLAQSPNPSNSPYRLPPIPKSTSGNDLVSGIVDKFNSLSVTDRDEERDRYQRQIAKLKDALDRACMAREEAEEEARRLRDRIIEEREERERERAELRARVGEWEKKYEKAKDRFKLQRVKNDEAMHKARAEFLEKEKGHWRNVAVAQEAEEWERKLRTDATELVSFLELERNFDVGSRKSISRPASVVKSHTRHVEQPSAPAQEQPDQDMPDSTTDEQSPTASRRATPDLDTATSRPSSRQHLHPNPHIDRELTPEGPPSMPIRPYHTPAKQVTRIPVDFGDAEPETDSEDKENAQPPTVADVLKTPLTIDRAAALAAIEYRRGRARSFMNAQMTPKTLAVVDKRDVSAPAMVTMSVGRKK